MYRNIEPYETGRLRVSDIHELYYELCGNKTGSPVVFLHGGPGGSGCKPSNRTCFNPEKSNIVLFDQRGCGESTPWACLEENTTWDLVEDISKLRAHLGISTWHVFGGSWGSMLAMAYAETYPDQVKSLILRAFFTVSKSTMDFFYQEGTSHFFPEAWDEFLAPIPVDERHDMMKAYHVQLNSEDPKKRIAAAKAWTKWEMTSSSLRVDPERIAQAENDKFAEVFAKTENHYFINGGFMRDGQLLEKQEIDKIRHIPTIVIQGRYDMLCTVTPVHMLKKLWPEIELHIVPDAGHSATEPGIARLLLMATDKFEDL